MEAMTYNEITTKCAEDIYEIFYPWACHEDNECFIECSNTRREGIEKLIPILTKRFTPLLRDKEILDTLQNNNLIHVRVHYDGREIFTKPYGCPNYSIREWLIDALQAFKPDKEK